MITTVTEAWAVRISDTCVVCGACTLVCPSQALTIEDDGLTVSLHLEPQACISCEACVSTCVHDAIEMDWVESKAVIVAHSDWVHCRGCGTQLAKQAEIDMMRQQLERAGYPEALLEFTANFCTRCKHIRSGILRGH